MLQNMLLKILNAEHASLIYQDKSYTTQQLGLRTLALIQALKDMHCGSDKIALCLPNSPELFCWQMACFYQGVPIVPLSYEESAAFIEEALKLTKPKYFLSNTEKKQSLSNIQFPKECKIKYINDACHESLAKSIRTQIKVNHSSVKDEDIALFLIQLDSEKYQCIQHSYNSAYKSIQALYEINQKTDNNQQTLTKPLGKMDGIATTFSTLLNNGTIIMPLN